MEKSKVLLTIAATVILSTNFTFADQGSLESNEYNKGEVKIITQEDIKQNAKDYSNYNLIINQSIQGYNI